MSNPAQTIEIFLPDGEPRGLRIAGITTRLVHAIQAPRKKLDKLLKREEASRVALYFLFGSSDGLAKPKAYIGQTEDLKARLRTHHAQKEFWNSVVAITSRAESFTQVHVRYLEWLSIERAKEANRYSLENGNAGARPHIPEPLEADVLDAFDTASTLLGTLGQPIFEPIGGSHEDRSGDEVVFCRGPSADGRGKLVDDGFLILEGSTCRQKQTASLGKTVRRVIDELVETGMLAESDDECYRVMQDLIVSSPSQASSIVLARQSSGWIEWKTADGRTLDEVYR